MKSVESYCFSNTVYIRIMYLDCVTCLSFESRVENVIDSVIMGSQIYLRKGLIVGMAVYMLGAVTEIHM